MNIENKFITLVSWCESSERVGWAHCMSHIIIITGIKFMGVGCYAEEGSNNIDMYGFSQSLVRRG